jgi:hypothetical protein
MRGGGGKEGSEKGKERSRKQKFKFSDLQRREEALQELSGYAILIQNSNEVYTFRSLPPPPPHGVRLSPLGTAATVWPIVPAPNDR